MKLPTAYVINLDRDVKRLESLSRNLGSIGLPFKRVPGVLGKEVHNWEQYVDLKVYAARNRQASPTLGELGCYLSHLKAMEMFLQTEDEWCVILEDDAEVLPECISVLENLSLKNDWDLVKLFNFHSGMPVKVRSLGNTHNLVIHLTRTTSSAAYAINRKAAEKLVRTMLPISECIDHALDRPWETRLRIRGVRPLPVGLTAHSQVSTIDYENKNYGVNSGLKKLALFFVRAKKEVQRFVGSAVEALGLSFKNPK